MGASFEHNCSWTKHFLNQENSIAVYDYDYCGIRRAIGGGGVAMAKDPSGIQKPSSPPKELPPLSVKFGLPFLVGPKKIKMKGMRAKIKRKMSRKKFPKKCS